MNEMMEEYYNYMEYLFVNNLTLDKNGNEVPIKEATNELILKITKEDYE